MTLEDLELFNQAITLAEDGKKAEAYQLLESLLQTYPDNARIWLCLAFTAKRLEEARLALAQASQLEPNNHAVIQAQNWLSYWEDLEKPRPRRPRPARPMSAARPVPSEFTPNLTSAAELAAMMRYNAFRTEPSIPSPAKPTEKKPPATPLPAASGSETEFAPTLDAIYTHTEKDTKLQADKRLLHWIA
jgi:tetratricopeptide (TPR) repeat protein